MPELKNKFFMVLSGDAERAAPLVRHKSYGVARREAQRLSNLHNIHFFVLKSQRLAVPDENWKPRKERVDAAAKIKAEEAA